MPVDSQRVYEEFCVMTPQGPHPAYSVRFTPREVMDVIKWDGGPGLSVGHRTRTVIKTAWEPFESAKGALTR